MNAHRREIDGIVWMTVIIWMKASGIEAYRIVRMKASGRLTDRSVKMNASCRVADRFVSMNCKGNKQNCLNQCKWTGSRH